MKKFLALLLALVMTMSLVTVGASAKTAFTDDKDITEVEAVEVLSAMGIIDGYKDGSFKPQGGLNRAAGAKFIAYLMLGEDAADGLKATGTLFEDVAADYALAPYVEWCAKMGIVDGYGNGKFGPTNTLTQAAFGKMLLTGLGYDSALEGYTGAGWQKAVYADGLAAGVYGDDGEVYEACDRETAAKLALGALTATMVEYGRNDKLVKVDAGKKDQNKDKVLQLFETYKDLEYTVENDVWGRPGHTWTYGKDFDKFYVDEAVATYTVATSECDICKDLGEKKEAKIDAIYTNGVNTDYYTYVDGDNKLVATVTGHKVGAQGQLVEIYDGQGDDKDEYRIVVVDTFLAKVTKVVEKKVDKNDHVTRDAYLTLDVKGLDGTYYVKGNDYEKDDYVLVNVNAEDDNNVTIKGLNNEVTLVEVVGAADSKEGKLTGATNSTTKIDKVAYDDAAKFVFHKREAKAAPNSGEKFVFFFDQYGNVIGCDDVDVTEKYTVIDKAYRDLVKGDDTAFANLVGFDGKTIVEDAEVKTGITVEKLAADNAGLEDDIYTYTVNDDDEYTFKQVGKTAVAGTYEGGWYWTYYKYTCGLTYDDDEAKISVDYNDVWNTEAPADDVIEMNKNTTVLVKDLYDEYKVFTGTTLPELFYFDTVAYTEFDADDANKDFAELVYITGAIYSDDGVTGYVFEPDTINWEDGFELITVWVGDKEVTVKVDSESELRKIDASGFYKFENKVDEDGETVVVIKKPLNTDPKYVEDSIVKVEGDVIDFNTSKSTKASDSFAIYEVDADEETVTAITYDDLDAMMDDEDTTITKCVNVYNKAGDLTAIYVFVAEAN